MEEIEIKFLGIDIPTIEKKLLDIGAVKVGEYFYKRRHFDYPGEPLDKNGEWIRVRDEGEKITMAHKKFLNYDRNVAVAKDVVVVEREVEVGDFDKACELLYAIGFIEKNYQENKRIRYVKGEIEYDIDIWPRIPPYLEIEGPELEMVQNAAIELGFDLSKAIRYTGWQIYNDYDINLHDYKSVTFGEWIKK